MLNGFFWIIIGALSGWIGYLATRTSEDGDIRPYIIVGIGGGLAGGISADLLGMSAGSEAIDPGSIFNALIVSAICISIFGVLLNFFGHTSSS